MADDEHVITSDEKYIVKVLCPQCGEPGAVGLSLATRLERVQGEPSRLGLKVGSGKAEHVCGQTAIVSETGEIIRLDLDGGGPHA